MKKLTLTSSLVLISILGSIGPGVVSHAGDELDCSQRLLNELTLQSNEEPRRLLAEKGNTIVDLRCETSDSHETSGREDEVTYSARLVQSLNRENRAIGAADRLVGQFRLGCAYVTAHEGSRPRVCILEFPGPVPPRK